jgi:phenylacetate-CoA ligase
VNTHIPEIEKKQLPEIKEFQEQALSSFLSYLIEHSKFYKELFKQHSIDISSIKV